MSVRGSNSAFSFSVTKLKSCFFCVTLLLSTACESTNELDVAIQTGPNTFRRFTPVSAIAEYLEFPSEPDQLKISVASYPLSCDHYEPPHGDQVFVSFLLKVPTGQIFAKGDFNWRGLPKEENDIEENFVLPYVRFSGGGRSLPPGGSFELISFQPEIFGQVVARAQLRGAEEGASHQIGVTAKINARLCRVSLDENRRKLE